MQEEPGHSVRIGLSEGTPIEVVTRFTEHWTSGFEVAELHVLPSYQGKGIGRELLLRLTSGRPERTAVLSTADAESRARRLYRGVGFTDLLTGFRFSGGEPAYAVMGARLPLLAGSAAPRSPRPSS